MEVLTLKITLQDEARKPLQAMADEAGVGLRDMAEIAVYNLIGLWQRDRGVGLVTGSDDPDIGCD